MSRLAPLAVALAAAVAPILAQPPVDTEANSPGVWRVVVHAAPHPLLTPAFRDRLRRDLLAALPAAAHPVATVEVVDLADLPRDRWDPLWQQVEAKGLAALDSPRDLTGVTTSVLRVEVRDGAYQLEARLYDGFAGLAAPPVRRVAVRAPELVGRAAGLLVGRDFGPVGTVEPVDGKAETAVIRFRGGAAGPLDKLVKVGDVFAVSKVTRTTRAAPAEKRSATGKLIVPAPGTEPPPALAAETRAYTYLRVAEPPQNGTAVCAVVTQFKTPFPKDANTAGYRALKLATVKSAVAVRLVGPGGDGASTQAATVRGSDKAFPAGRPDQREFFDFANGVYTSNRPLDGLAYVTVALGATNERRFPVPVFGPDAVGLPFAVTREAEEKAAYERAVFAAAGRASEALVAQATGFAQVGALIKQRRNAEALAQAKAVARSADTAAALVTEEVAALKGRPGSSPEAEQFLARVAQHVERLKTTNGLLAERVRDLEAVVAREAANGAPQQVAADALNVRLRGLLEGGEIDEALAAYDQLLTITNNDANLKARRDQLAAEWRPKSDEHAKAREYLTKTWPAVATQADLKDSLPRVRAAVDVLKAAGDRHGLRRFARLLAAAPARVEALAQRLEPTAAEELAALRETARVLGVLDQEVAEFLRK